MKMRRSRVADGECLQRLELGLGFADLGLDEEEEDDDGGMVVENSRWRMLEKRNGVEFLSLSLSILSLSFPYFITIFINLYLFFIFCKKVKR